MKLPAEFLGRQHPDQPSRISSKNGRRRDIACYDRARAYDGMVADCNAFANNRSCTDKYIDSNPHGSGDNLTRIIVVATTRRSKCMKIRIKNSYVGTNKAIVTNLY
jgi:hypothetical protein